MLIQQLAARDPQDKQRKLHQVYKTKYENRFGQRITIKSMWADIPHIYKSSFYDFLIGYLIMWVFPQIWISRYAFPVAILSMTVLFLIGFMIGIALDVRDNISDLTR